MRIKISDHAVKRYRERIAIEPPANDLMARVQMFALLCQAKPKHLRRMDRNTAYVIAPGCIFVASHGTIVTVLDKMREEAA